MVDVVENMEVWRQQYETRFLAFLDANGYPNFKEYDYVRNSTAPQGPGVVLSKSRLVFITTAGAYLKANQEAFDASNHLGDYSLRTFPITIPFDALEYAHEHYDHTAVRQDPQVLLPFHHLQAMVAQGRLGSLAPMVISYSGYQPDVQRVVEELLPQVVGLAKDQNADAALLVPA